MDGSACHSSTLFVSRGTVCFYLFYILVEEKDLVLLQRNKAAIVSIENDLMTLLLYWEMGILV